MRAAAALRRAAAAVPRLPPVASAAAAAADLVAGWPAAGGWPAAAAAAVLLRRRSLASGRACLAGLGIVEQLREPATVASPVAGAASPANLEWQVVQFTPDGGAVETTATPDSLGMHPRDVYNFADASASEGGAAGGQGAATLAPRDAHFLFRTEACRAVVAADRAVLWPGRRLADSVRVAQVRRERSSAGRLAGPLLVGRRCPRRGAPSCPPMSSERLPLLQAIKDFVSGPSSLPFELRVLEALLSGGSRGAGGGCKGWFVDPRCLLLLLLLVRRRLRMALPPRLPPALPPTARRDGAGLRRFGAPPGAGGGDGALRDLRRRRAAGHHGRAAAAGPH